MYQFQLGWFLKEAKLKNSEAILTLDLIPTRGIDI